MNSNDAGKDRTKTERRTGTAAVLGLFMAAVLAATPGCGTADNARSGHVHIDQNNDGYCDEDGERIPANSSGYSDHHHYYGGGYSGPHYGGSTPTSTTVSSPSAKISSGAVSHGGIGGTGGGGGG